MYLYLTLFAVLFFVRGNVPVVAFGPKNAQRTALAILSIAIPALVRPLRKPEPTAA